MTIHINLSPQMESYIKAKLSSGRYGSATEVVRDALRQMQADDQRSAAFQSAAAGGEAERDRGEGVRYNQDAPQANNTREAPDDNSTPSEPDVRPRAETTPNGVPSLLEHSAAHAEKAGTKESPDLSPGDPPGVGKRLARPRRRTSKQAPSKDI